MATRKRVTHDGQIITPADSLPLGKKKHKPLSKAEREARKPPHPSVAASLLHGDVSKKRKPFECWAIIAKTWDGKEFLFHAGFKTRAYALDTKASGQRVVKLREVE